jgi:hypothetical protein
VAPIWLGVEFNFHGCAAFDASPSTLGTTVEASTIPPAGKRREECSAVRCAYRFPCFDHALTYDAQISGLPRTLGGLLRFPKGGPNETPRPRNRERELTT